MLGKKTYKRSTSYMNFVYWPGRLDEALHKMNKGKITQTNSFYLAYSSNYNE